MNQVTKLVEVINSFSPTPLAIVDLALISVIAIIGLAIVVLIKT